ncbi:serine hydrolase domain-containing protein [Hydrogenispora ethanolica]|nr:serine hydrolase domain-containing protein [Hydrogenispora ethanolica]
MEKESGTMPNLKTGTNGRGPWRCILWAVLLAVLTGLPVQTHRVWADGAENRYAALESYIPAAMKQSRVPGLALAIFDGQGIVYSKGFGVKKAGAADPVGEDTIFQAASLSKTVTAYAAMILVERGQLGLDEPLGHYLKKPYLPNPRDAERITLRMVLNHTSGMSNDSDGKDRKVYFTPGTRFSYSGAGFRYLQQVLEEVTGSGFAEWVEREVFKPLGMNLSSFAFQEERLALMAYGHEAGVAFPIARKAVNAAYSLLTTPSDLARFYAEVCRPTLLKPETVAMMLTPAVQWRKDIYWGLGFGILKSPDAAFFWHWGNTYYYTNMMIAGKDSGTGAVIMTNGNTGMRLAERLAIKVANEYLLETGAALNPETFDFIR